MEGASVTLDTDPEEFGLTFHPEAVLPSREEPPGAKAKATRCTDR